jgi:hypothetical protein
LTFYLISPDGHTTVGIEQAASVTKIQANSVKMENGDEVLKINSFTSFTFFMVL